MSALSKKIDELFAKDRWEEARKHILVALEDDPNDH